MCHYSLYYMIITIIITLFTEQVTDKTNKYINCLKLLSTSQIMIHTGQRTSGSLALVGTLLNKADYCPVEEVR